ncbi:uncharacterized protein SCHCODRAFT_02665040 [Schizophyllum commune H4-8]|uniref:uncharacterized protein n=1 Tax=Schizophyllum commune (strain H4-8 / FGSC 9210) TaxID=578458 RepID=UPI002160BEBE|nr:uncharacterized protein SCHCODRAFT_02665040 [Schizophyllum commune H4-8]KAI5894525.1 hypothetical protein SCHCODRAFT_02665040 [Schizophyllum commune H4-8]
MLKTSGPPVCNNLSHLQEPGTCDDTNRMQSVPGQDMVFRYKDTNRSVVFTTITTACASEDVTEAMLDSKFRDALFARPGFPEPLTRPRVPAYYIEPAGDKGLGMFAARHLRTGSLIVSERPLTLEPTRRAACDTCDHPSCRTAPAKYIKYTRAEQEKHLQLMLNRMSKERREAFLSLKDSSSANRAGNGPLLGRAHTNAWTAFADLQFEGASGEDCKYLATFDMLSRMNHSCRPNALFAWDTRTFSGTLRAARDIAPGEEITVAYFGDVHIPLVQRRAFLAPYGFECACPACSAGDTADARCARILTDYEELPDPLTACTLVEFGYRYAIQRMEEEGLESLNEYYFAHLHLTLHYRFVRNVEKAMIYQGKLNALSWAQCDQGVRTQKGNLNIDHMTVKPVTRAIIMTQMKPVSRLDGRNVTTSRHMHGHARQPAFVLSHQFSATMRAEELLEQANPMASLELQRGGYVPSAHQSWHIHEMSRALSSEASDIETEIARLQHLHRRISIQLDIHKSITAPIRRLPLELLSEIFAILFDREDESHGKAYIVIYVLCRVCSAWRTLVRATPRLWTRIPTRVFPPELTVSLAHFHHVPDHISLSGSLPLCLTHIEPNDDALLEKFLVKLGPHLARIGIIDFDGSCAYFAAVGDNLRMPNAFEAGMALSGPLLPGTMLLILSKK